MADRILCKYCGWQETNHYEGDLGVGNPDTPILGYKKTLNECRGFTPEDPVLARQIKKQIKQRKAEELAILVQKNPS